MGKKKSTETVNMTNTSAPLPQYAGFYQGAIDALVPAAKNSSQFVQGQMGNIGTAANNALGNALGGTGQNVSNQFLGQMGDAQAQTANLQNSLGAMGGTFNSLGRAAEQMRAPTGTLGRLESGIQLGNRQVQNIANQSNAAVNRAASQQVGDNNAGLNFFGTNALGMSDTFGNQGSALGGQIQNTLGQFDFDQSANNAALGQISQQVGGLNTSPDLSRINAAGQAAQNLPGQYQFGANPVQANTSGLNSLAGQAAGIGNQFDLSANTGALDSLSSQAAGLGGQFNLGNVPQVNVDTTGLEDFARQIAGNQANIPQVVANNAGLGMVGSAAFGLPGQFNLANVPQVSAGNVGSQNVTTNNVTADRANANNAPLQAAMQTAQGLPGQYQFGANEGRSDAVSQSVADIIAGRQPQASALDRDMRLAASRNRVSYDGPNDIIGGESSQDYVDRVLAGEFLNSNPYIDDMARLARENAFNDVSSAFGRSGMTRSTGFGDALGSGIADAESGLRFNAYNTERGFQDSAARLGFDFAGLRTGTAANAAAQRMNAQQANAANSISTLGMRSDLLNTGVNQALQGAGLQGDIANNIAGRELTAQQLASSLGLNAAQLQGSLASNIAANDLTAGMANADRTLTADTGNANRALTADTTNAGNQLTASQANAGNTLAASGQNAGNFLQGNIAQAGLGLDSLGLAGNMASQAAGNNLTASQANASNALARANLGLDGATTGGNLMSEAARIQLAAQQSNAGNALQGNTAQAGLALDSLGLAGGLAGQSATLGQQGQQAQANLALGGLGLGGDLLGQSAGLDLTGQQSTAQNTLAAQQAAAGLGSDAVQQQLAAAGLGLDGQQLGIGNALSAAGLQADIGQNIAQNDLTSQQAAANNSQATAQLLAQLLGQTQGNQIAATGQGLDAIGQASSMAQNAEAINAGNALQAAGMTSDNNAQYAQNILNLLGLQGQAANTDISLLGQQNQNAATQMAGIGLQNDIANAGVNNQINLGNAATNNANADLAQLNAYLQMLQTGATLPLVGPGALVDGTSQLFSPFTTNTQQGTIRSKQTGGLLEALIGAGAQVGGAAILASERRVKRDISLIGREDDGLGVYHYRYIWDAPDAPLRAGVMVDEVEKIRPWALGPVVDGIQTVNYGALV